MATRSRSAEIRARLAHPVIDGDGHIVEFMPALFEHIQKLGGRAMGPGTFGEDGPSFGGSRMAANMPRDARRLEHVVQAPWWALPTENTLDRATSMLPRLLYERLPDFGLDFAVLYPTAGLAFPHLGNDEVRPACCRAYNEYVAEQFGEYSDRLTPAAVVPMHTPEEAIAELEHAHALGLKVAMIAAYVIRPVPGYAAKYPELARRLTRLDTFGIDSEYDYDPFWARCIELGMPPICHSSGMGFTERSSTSLYMYNHIGHFAAAGEALAKSLFMGGVTCRFPALRVGLLEGGVASGARLYADLIGRWQKRGGERVRRLDPRRLDHALARELFAKYGDAKVQASLDGLKDLLGGGFFAESPDEIDDFRACPVSSVEELRDRFVPNFYFGCEADDPMNALAFSDVNPLGARIRAFMGSDIGHWDVVDMTEALEEAYELVEHGHLDDGEFRDFAFTNSIHLYAGMNSEFFAGTAIEAEARRERERVE